MCWLTHVLHNVKILGLHPPKALHIKAAEQVTGVISHITYMSLAGIEYSQRVGKIWGKLCVSHLIAIPEQIASVR